MCSQRGLEMTRHDLVEHRLRGSTAPIWLRLSLLPFGFPVPGIAAGSGGPSLRKGVKYLEQLVGRLLYFLNPERDCFLQPAGERICGKAVLRSLSLLEQIAGTWRAGPPPVGESDP